MAPGTELERIEAPPESLWEKLRENPERTPEIVALYAGEHFGPQAERYAARMGSPAPEKSARIALRRHVRLARLEGAALGLGGFTTAAADFAALVWVQCRMVFFIAAAYGFDPNHPMRPAELLALRDIYPNAAEARTALDGLGPLMAGSYVQSKLTRQDNRSTLVRFAARKAAERGARRMIPLVSSPINAIANAAATKDLGGRAIAYYGGGQPGAAADPALLPGQARP